MIKKEVIKDKKYYQRETCDTYYKTIDHKNIYKLLFII